MKILYTLILISATSFVVPLYKIEQQEMRNSFTQLVKNSQYVQRFHSQLDKKLLWFYYSMQRDANTLQQCEKNEFLSIAATTGYYEFVKLFINAGAEVNHTAPAQYLSDGDNYTPLHRAFRYGANLDTILLLLENGAHVHAVDNMGRSPLHLAMLGYICNSVYKSYDTRLRKIKLLLELRALINAADINGDTPLHLAVLHTEAGVVKFLLRNGADMHARNNKGETPLDIAKKYAVGYNILPILMHHNNRCALL